ncbi:MAG: 23S rRNA (guanosine(2251)-2'-O)-methyltransferase RlmB [Myxococcales bacterium]|nr:23S rRNA (guanosine(2251)-2'-O)-methyltransferase RlmB [Myxococcales bacterium]MDH3844683.1 23S rRNA (guanosine(2251)-2'-O)-methyltransferase RlmB [Myxococcales bacterium]
MSRVLAGRRPVLEALRGNAKIHHVIMESENRFPDVTEAAQASGVPISTKPRADLDRLTEGARHQGVMALADPYVFFEVEELVARSGHYPLLIALDEVTDPQNLGAIIRSAVTLGLDGLVIPKHRAAGITPAVVRASAGATEHAAIARVTNLQRTLLSLHETGMEIIGLDAAADIGIRDLEPAHGGRVLVIGSEGKGLRRMVRQRCDIVVHIPQEGPMDSLNASVAAAIAMYEVAAKRGRASREH